jgi:hypothetical protein
VLVVAVLSAALLALFVARARRNQPLCPSTAFTDDIAIVPNALTLSEISALRAELTLLEHTGHVQHNVQIQNRLVVPAPPGSYAAQLFGSRSFLDRLSQWLGEDSLRLATIVPVEYRVYMHGGAMKPHRDVVLSTPPQYEVVLTLDNDSDSLFVWTPNEAAPVKRAVQTAANTLVAVRAGGVVHEVTPVTRGTRTIIKIAVIPQRANPMFAPHPLVTNSIPIRR